MKLADLAFCCYCYGLRTKNDRAYLSFIQSTGGAPNIDDPEHRSAILDWLNDWGCRQFAIDHHPLAAQALLDWHTEFSDRLPSATTHIWELSQTDYTAIRDAYDSLSQCTASYRRHGATQTKISFGATGAAKTLFSIRPNSLAPWDKPIRKSLGYDSFADSYIDYLKTITQLLNDLQPQCERHGFALGDLPVRLLRPDSSVPKLIDEYYWMTITQNWQPPGGHTFQDWADWSG